MTTISKEEARSLCNCSRRDFIRQGLAGIGLGVGLPFFLQRTATALAAETLLGKEKNPNRILLVVELNGGCDGLDTVVPYGRDEYYKMRPSIGIRKEQVRKLDDELGFHPGFIGAERLFKDGKMAVIHGCSYPNPNFSHFKSMEFWHTGVPNGAESLGWLGRTMDTLEPEPVDNLIVNISPSMKLAVQSNVHAPIVFNAPNRFVRDGLSADEEQALAEVVDVPGTKNETLQFLRGISRTAAVSSKQVRTACSEYRTQTNFGLYMNLRTDLRNVSALIAGGFPTRVYYTALAGWDTHSNQLAGRGQLMSNLDDGLSGFMDEMQRIGRADDVAILVFTEFGRRAEENSSGGTDHGTAAPMFLIGKNIKGGFYSEHPSLTDLDAGNLKMTTDFRRVYATVIKEWLGYEAPEKVLKAQYETFPVVA